MPWAVETEADFEHVMAWALALQEAGTGQAFVIENPADGAVFGSTCYLNADHHNLRVEIGGTWITPDVQRTGVNTECKWLLLQHAFEDLDANRVEFKTDSMNERSRAAISRIGAREEGTLRNHMVRPDGSLRHSTYFSVTVEEWPGVEQHLVKLKRAYT
jgi:RimJ/RimL family protein N-acetyltransferase